MKNEYDQAYLTVVLASLFWNRIKKGIRDSRVEHFMYEVIGILCLFDVYDKDVYKHLIQCLMAIGVNDPLSAGYVAGGINWVRDFHRGEGYEIHYGEVVQGYNCNIEGISEAELGDFLSTCENYFLEKIEKFNSQAGLI